MTGKQNRAYKKGRPHRDARLFVIVAEGEREDRYFQWFQGKSQRLQIRIVERSGGASAPNFMLERAHAFLQESGLTQRDMLWFVLDVDRWKREEIEILQHACRQQVNWHIAISNPCFEVWLHYHLGGIDQIIPADCASLKRSLAERVPGGFEIARFAPKIREASRQARAADNSAGPGFPDIKRTKLYLLADELLSLLGVAV